jgi:hypothetical protein
VGEQTVDFSAELDGQVQVTNAAGEQGVQAATALALTEEAIFAQSLN